MAPAREHVAGQFHRDAQDALWRVGVFLAVVELVTPRLSPMRSPLGKQFPISIFFDRLHAAHTRYNDLHQ